MVSKKFQKHLFFICYSTTNMCGTFPITCVFVTEICKTVYISQFYSIYGYVGVN